METFDRKAPARNRLTAAVADLDLSPPELGTLEWLMRWETETIDRIASVIEKARSAE